MACAGDKKSPIAIPLADHQVAKEAASLVENGDFSRHLSHYSTSVTWLPNSASNEVGPAAGQQKVHPRDHKNHLLPYESIHNQEWCVAGSVDLSTKHRPAVNTHEHLPLDATELAAVMQRHDCEVSALISASDADFERYMSHHRHATVRWALTHKDHPDHDEVASRSMDEWNNYLRKVRPYLGWTIVVGHKA